MKILITGASGYIGKNIFKHLLKENLEVFGKKCHESFIKEFELEELKEKNKQVKKISNGQLQRLNILRLMEIRNKVIIFDEALSGVDQRLRKKIITQLLGLENTIIIVNHGLLAETIGAVAVQVIDYESPATDINA